jgi:hypothetical protein
MKNIYNYSPSGLPAISPTRGETADRTAPSEPQWLRGTQKPLPLVGRGWGGVFNTVSFEGTR